MPALTLLQLRLFACTLWLQLIGETSHIFTPNYIIYRAKLYTSVPAKLELDSPSRSSKTSSHVKISKVGTTKQKALYYIPCMCTNNKLKQTVQCTVRDKHTTLVSTHKHTHTYSYTSLRGLKLYQFHVTNTYIPPSTSLCPHLAATCLIGYSQTILLLLTLEDDPHTPDTLQHDSISPLARALPSGGPPCSSAAYKQYGYLMSKS